MSYFNTLVVVNRGSETQLQVGEFFHNEAFSRPKNVPLGARSVDLRESSSMGNVQDFDREVGDSFYQFIDPHEG